MIRVEDERDWAAVYELNVAAFDTPAEAKLVDELRGSAEPFVSLVADESGQIVGQIAFSPVSIEGLENKLVMGLGPMAVAPEEQRRGIGAALIKSGLEHCRGIGCGDCGRSWAR